MFSLYFGFMVSCMCYLCNCIVESFFSRPHSDSQETHGNCVNDAVCTMFISLCVGPPEAGASVSEACARSSRGDLGLDLAFV